jgi:quinol monooxygenase YgiN
MALRRGFSYLGAMALTLAISGTTHSGRRDDLFASFERHLAPRALTNHAQAVVVWTALDHPDKFQLFEIYADPAAAAANAQAEWFGAYLSETMPLLAGPPEMVQGTPRWSKGVTV